MAIFRMIDCRPDDGIRGLTVVAEDSSTALNQEAEEGDEVEAGMAFRPSLDRRLVDRAVVEDQVNLADRRGLAIEHRK